MSFPAFACCLCYFKAFKFSLHQPICKKAPKQHGSFLAVAYTIHHHRTAPKVGYRDKFDGLVAHFLRQRGIWIELAEMFPIGNNNFRFD